MKRTLAAALVLSIAASTSAFAGGIGRSGTYGPQWSTNDSSAPKTRAEVKAELVQSYRDGTLPSMNKTSYPEQGLVGRTQAERLAVQQGLGDDATRVARAGQ
ncbi:DUF4148 domain-containing protein [Paraburkholderia caballeronis]|uniref:DUF4148 domain-containing protein n=1 Tax=Paraburkholderia caballeronis TaxID=416943 RepID=UPI001065BE64|nr:DUF4148 domain-containing protein [Paraburkholderia caballeronis]TDV15017.1 uncharacterized protein DUF4148 [Paraburkholderia caballeronis]TDV16858.1 uncharacterized protein DUF4148 [Paraburkholderia caballeronis]TDV25753.1 uncharacterized protein DUF4148 [Paraburkholderia caballeronis]TDV34391.1 uncharacterized protein DUF4148 [Paraburkholderia caballeronis]